MHGRTQAEQSLISWTCLCSGSHFQSRLLGSPWEDDARDLSQGSLASYITPCSHSHPRTVDRLSDGGHCMHKAEHVVGAPDCLVTSITRDCPPHETTAAYGSMDGGG